MSEHVSVSREDRDVVVVRMNRPEKKNALTGAMYDALTDALIEADRSGVGAVVLTGSDGTFTAGNDIADFLAGGGGDCGDRPAQSFIKQLAVTQTPLVAAVDGIAIGIGTTLTLHCDLVYASPSAVFRMPFVDLGLVPEAGSSYLLPRRVGQTKAAEFLMLGEAYDAREALRLGLVNAIVEAGELAGHATRQAGRLSTKPRAALAATRRLLRGDGSDLKRAMEAEMVAFGEALGSSEAKAAFDAFLARSAKPPR